MLYNPFDKEIRRKEVSLDGDLNATRVPIYIQINALPFIGNLCGM